MSIEEKLAAEYRAAQRARAAEKGALVKFAGLYHSVSTGESMSLHRGDCGAIEREREDHASNVERFEEESITAALDHMVDEEMREMGYDHNSVKVHSCTKEATVPVKTVLDPTDASGVDGASGATDRKPRRIRRKPAPVTVRHDPSIVRDPATNRKAAVKPAPKKERATASKAAVKPAPKAKAKAPANRSRIQVPDGFKSWDDKRLIARIVKEKQAGSTIKAIAESLGLPPKQGSWFRVSKVWREEADRQNLNRPRRSK